MQFIPGQRWTSETEPELGLGTVCQVDGRRISINFEASQCLRTYSAASAPLKRVLFASGDTITTKDGRNLLVEEVQEVDGLLIYLGEGTQLPETDLADTLSFSTPLDRLKNGFSDTPDLFDLRARALSERMAAMASPVRGFIGGRMALIPHQLFIASEVASRHLPRVLLADEVGLGKTIEACLILHRLLMAERIHRALILVPDVLVHQWFVELLRRFNLQARIADENHFAEMAQSDPDGNPFHSHQLFICGFSFFQKSKRAVEALDAGFDIAIVDEAHQIHDDHTLAPFLNQLSRNTQGLLLLTATPEQLGEEAHFAQLKRLDAARHNDFERFQMERKREKETAHLAAKIMDKAPLSKDEEKRVASLFPEKRQAAEEIITRLIDCHGPGRVIFRNTRRQIKGFPARSLFAHALDATPEQLTVHHARLGLGSQAHESQNLTGSPEILWLASFLREAPDEKVLLICQRRETVEAIGAALAQEISVKMALFHEGMSLVQRDRNAAWFSEHGGARLLICSEMGSEGRNFQFCRHLVLFDLPLNPEKVEQRIGRLDRIGQKHDITIHVPFIKGSASEVATRWYESTGIFAACTSSLRHLGDALSQHTLDLMRKAAENRFDEGEVARHCRSTENLKMEVEEELAKGRDRLLEMSAHRPEKVEALLAEIHAQEKRTDLEPLLTEIFEHHGMGVDETSENILSLALSEETTLPLPPMKRNPLFVTFKRDVALSREELEFLTMDHPLVVGALESFCGSETGNAALAIYPDAPHPGLLLECLFVPECVAPQGLGAARFLTQAPFRVVMDHEGDEVTQEWPEDLLKEELAPMPDELVGANPAIMDSLLPAMANGATALADAKSEALKKRALESMHRHYDAEIQRLIYLKKANTDLPEEEILSLMEEKNALTSHLGTTRLRLDAIRVILLN